MVQKKDPDTGKDWRQEEKGMTKNEMAGRHHWLNGHESEQAPWDAEGQGRLACCTPWGCRVGHDWVIEQQVQKQVRVFFFPFLFLSRQVKLDGSQNRSQTRRGEIFRAFFYFPWLMALMESFFGFFWFFLVTYSGCCHYHFNTVCAKSLSSERKL